MKLQKPKGTYDLDGRDANIFLYLKAKIEDMMRLYNYQFIRTPSFESSELFYRGTGETTDIVTKETYDFIDRGGRKMTLIPEGTTSVVRSYLENKRYADKKQPVKFYYVCPIYRYERPQANRFREHFQFGIEIFGSHDPMIEAEVISIAVNLYQSLGLKGIKVKLNSLGDKRTRLNYRQALLSYFKPYLNELCEDCNHRYYKNPLRILDCKVDANKEIMVDVPKINKFLSESSINHFNLVKKYLDELKINYQEVNTLVRGLDYYTETVFEIEALIKGFGSQNVLCGGGRYDNLIETLGGPSIPAVGFGMGIERLMEALKSEKIVLPIDDRIDLYVVALTDNEKVKVLKLIQELRNKGFKVDTDYLNRNLKKQFKQADYLKAKYIIIVGQEEQEGGFLTIKNNQIKEEVKINNEDLTDYLRKYLN